MRRSVRDLPPEERALLTEAQVKATRPIVSGVLAASGAILAISGAFEALGMVPGIGYPWWLVELAAATIVGLAIAIWLLDDWRVRLLLTLLSVALYGVFLSLPLPGDSAQLAIRAGLFQLVPIVMLALLARPTSVTAIIVLTLALAFSREYLHGPPPSGSGLYWLFNLTTVAFGLLLSSYKTDFAVAVFRARRELQRQATTDGLTGLLNRAGWNEISERVHEDAASRAQPVSLAFFDLDHFKHVNDTWGHEAGDTVLQTLGGLLKTRAGARTTCARLGGEEFVALVVGEPPDAVEGFVERIRREFEEAARDMHVTLSAGVSHRQPGESFSQQLRRADLALYAAKHEGRNRLVVSQVEG